MNITEKSQEILNDYCAIVGATTISVADYIQIRKQASAELQQIGANTSSIQKEAPNIGTSSYEQVEVAQEMDVKPSPAVQTENISQPHKTIPMRQKKSVASIMRAFD